MRRFWHRTPRELLLALAIAVLLLANSGFAASRNDKSKIPLVRWDEQRPGCTFSRSDDGKYRYGLSDGDVRITVAVDFQELEKVRHRPEPFFAVLLNVSYKGPAAIDFDVNNISLEFVRHFRVVKTSLDPDDFSQKVQNDADELDHQTAREVGKHPEQKETKEAYVRAFRKDSAELQEFVGNNSLRVGRLGPGNPETSGWVMFSTQSKWISGWKKPEEFILRVPFDGKIFEFPFKLPLKPGEIILRRRE
jgi:hypothetical protein